MARLILIEDMIEYELAAMAAVMGTEHTVTNNVRDLTQAHEVLRRVALGDIEADYVLVDGNLGSRSRPVFRFTPPGHELPPLQPAPTPVKRRGWRGLVDTAIDVAVKEFSKPAPPPTPAEPRYNPHEIIVDYKSEGPQFQNDGRQVCRIVRALNAVPELGLDLKIIGVSRDVATVWGGDVDYDLTKSRISTLATFIDDIEAARA